MEEKVLISLFAVAVGWLLAQGTTLVKLWWNAKQMRRSLFTELEDIQDQLQRVVLIHKRQIQIAVHKGIEPTAALPIFNTYFKQYFKETFPYLSRSQRISYQLIHALLDNLNAKNDDLAVFAEKAFDDLRNASDKESSLPVFEAWRDRVTSLYKTAMTIRWHIAYHIKNSRNPAFDIQGPMHESYVKFMAELEDHVKEIMEKAEKLNKDAFDRIYDPSDFPNK